MNNVEIVGIVAGALSCTTFLPQVIKTYKSKSTKDVSLAMFVIAAVSTSLWLIYGVLISSFSLTFTNAIVLLLSLVMLYLKLKYRNHQK